MEHWEIEQVLHTIRHAEPSVLSRIVQALLKRYEELYADEDVFFLSAPKGDLEERTRIMAAALRLDRTHSE